MANTKVGRINRLITAQNSSVVLKNGTGGGAPALIESAPYVMSNLLHYDRSTPWKSSTLLDGVDYDVDFETGVNPTIDTAGLQGYRLLSGEGSVTLKIYYQTGAYTPGGTWTQLGATLGLGSRDRIAQFADTAVASLRFRLNSSGDDAVLAISKFGAWDVTDMGGIHSPGGTATLFKNRLETPLPSGAIAVTKLGDDGATFTFPWRELTTSQRATLRQLQATDYSVLLIDADGDPHECFVQGGQLVETRNFLIDGEFTLVKLP